jgi:benzil reductase ((S)-benzoin forming)
MINSLISEYWWISGTSSGIGKALAETVLKRKSSAVIGLSRTNTISHPNYTHHTIDLSLPKNLDNFYFHCNDSVKKLILVNNAGTLGEIAYAGDLSNHGIESTYNVNIVSPHILINEFINTFKAKACQKIIVNISSGAAVHPYDGWNVYCATKAAMDMMTACIEKEQETFEKKKQFKIYTLAPGVVNTKMQDQIRRVDPKSFSKKAKFIELHDKHGLIDPFVAANKVIDIVER